MTVVAPLADTAGAALDAHIATVQALVTATSPSKVVYPQYVQLLNSLQVEAVDHYMVTGWLNAASILLTYTPPPWDKVGKAITARIAELQALYNTALVTPMPVGNADGYGSAGWTTIAAAFAQQLYAKQVELVEHIMTLPGGTSAATMLANLTGVQTAPGGIVYNYAFSSVGFTDEWLD